MVRNAHTAQGFTLLEVLITLVLIAGALLGTAGMQSFAMKVNQSAQFRGDAIVLAIDLMERIEANNAAAWAGTYKVANLPAGATSTTDCSVSFCSAEQLAGYDLKAFSDNLTARLPAGTASVDYVVTGTTGTYTLQISWTERITRQKSTEVAGGADTETFSYTVSRTVYNRITGAL